MAVKYWPVPASVTRATPASVPVGGGSQVAVAGRGFPDVASLGCRFGTIGPVTAQWGASTRVACHSPAKAPSAAPVAVLNTWGVEAARLRSTGVGGGAVTVRFRAAAEAHVALPPAARRPGGPALTLVGVSGPAAAEEPLVCRVGGGAEERARCAPTDADAAGRALAFLAPRGRLADWGLECGGGGGGAGDGVGVGPRPLAARCNAPPSSGDAFDVLTLGFTAETAARGNSGEPGLNAAGGAGVEIEYAEDPLAIAATPAAAPAEGGARITVTGAYGAWSFGGGAHGHVGGEYLSLIHI